MSKTLQSSVPDLVEKIALELVFAEPGKDVGLLPINSLLSEIEAQLPPPPSAMREAVGLARQCVDLALQAGTLEGDTIARLGAWCAWMRESLAAEAQKLPPPPLPAALTAAPASAPQSSPAPRAASEAADEALQLDVSASGDLLREFVEEGCEHLQRIELDAIELEKVPGNKDALNSLFRSFHTLKGGSGFLNLLPMNRLAHELESLLDLARQGKLQGHGSLIEIILTGRDALRQFLTQIERRLSGKSQGEPIQVRISPLLSRIRALQTGVVDAPAVGSPGNGPCPPSGSAPAESASQETRHATGFVKVDTAKLDYLIDLVGELVIAQSQVMSDKTLRAGGGQTLTRNLSQLGRISTDLQRTAMSLRMVPIRATFQKMTRVVRDLAAKAGKQVELQLDGEGTELDRNLIEQISDPLIHMIRNAVDHGIEPPQERVARGKAPQGHLKLCAHHRGGNIVIEISDDGAGLNRGRILEKGRAAGLIAANSQPSEQEILNLIFAPGFSTAERVTDISGRGVGMDVVRRNITKLHGRIDIKSEPGAGSTFAIHIPLTLAIIDGLIFSIAGERFILPALCVRESFRPKPGMITTVLNQGETICVRGQFSPLVRLGHRFGLQTDSTDPTQGIVIVVESDHRRCGLLVDHLIAKQEVVIKGLDDTLKRNRALAGAAILGDGKVGLILDVNGLLERPDNRLSHN